MRQADEQAREARWRNPARPASAVLDAASFHSADEMAIRRTAREFAQTVVAPVADEIERVGAIDQAVHRSIGGSGLLALTVPVGSGGGGATAAGGCVAVEEIGRASSAVAATMCVQICGGLYPRLFPDEAQRERIYASFVGGGLLAIGATERDAGTDVNGYSMRATRQGGRWRLNGTKYFVTNGGLASLYFVFARDESGDLTAFLLDADRCNLTVRPIELVGWRGARVAEVAFVDVDAGDEDVVGAPGGALDLLQRVFTAGRLYNAALSLGIGRAALDYAAAYAGDRVSGGKPLIRQQSIQFMLADVVAELLDLRVLMGSVGRMWDEASRSPTFHPSVLAATAMVKMRSTRASRMATEAAAYVLGARAFEVSSIAPRLQRDAAALIYTEGTDAVQRKGVWRACHADPALGDGPVEFAAARPA